MESIEQIEKQAIDELGTVKDTESINDLRVHYLGRKGVLTGIMRNISQMPKEERPSAGKKANQVKGILEKAFDNALQQLESD
ncbi:MAG: phenylalanine--tRNA ligase subunit alpha, partial [Deltaproteobacteria bacterium]|nr:phenylalanine--tRNA ligase subunit alpha [Deltaproteobacteria bacterium]